MIHFYLNANGDLSCTIGREVFEKIYCKKAFPLDNKLQAIGVFNQFQKEIAWMPNLMHLLEKERCLVLQSIEKHSPIKFIQNILNCSSIVFPSIWYISVGDEKKYIQIDEQDHLSFYAHYGTLIKDSMGEYYLIPNQLELDKSIQKKLSAFIL